MGNNYYFNKINKKVKILMLIFVILLMSFTFSNVKGADYKIEDYKINAIVKENGDLEVEEFLKYKFNEDMNGVFREIMYKYDYSNQISNMKPTSSRYQAKGVSDVSVYTSDSGFDNMNESKLSEGLSNGMSDVYSMQNIASDGYKVSLKVYSPVKSGAYKYVKYKFVVNDVSVKYLDKGELYWNFLGKDWTCSIENLNINISFENKIDLNEALVYPHSYVKNISSSKTNSQISINATNVNSGVAVDSRVVFPVTALGNVTKNINENYDINKLNEVEKEMSFGNSKYFLSITINILLIIFAIAIIIIMIIKINKVTSKYVPKNEDINYYTEPLEGRELAEYVMITNKFSGYGDTNVLLATILDLSNRKYINLECLKKVKKSIFSSNAEYDYFITINQKANFNELTEYEKLVINYIFEYEATSQLEMEKIINKRIELNDTFETLSTKTSIINKYNKKVLEMSSKKESSIYQKISINNYISIILMLIPLIVGFFINNLFISPLTDNFSILAAGGFGLFIYFIIIMVIITNACKLIKEEVKQDYKNIKGLEKYLKDYSLIKDRYPIEMVLWEKYLVFATLFGIADKVSKEFKEELIQKGYDDEYIYNTHPLMGMAIYSSTMRSMATSATSIASSSSSGGYSGGGSGGGGRWWPVAAVHFSFDLWCENMHNKLKTMIKNELKN